MRNLTKLFSKVLVTLILSTGFCYGSYTIVEDQVGAVIKSPALQNVQRVKIRLENGLEAFVVSDPSATKSGAALSVGVGWNNEPFEHVGVAHFVEHMLFMGTEKYPVEKEYSDFIQSNGGYSNAYTSSDKTVYYFQVNNEQTEEALDRFSSFFVSPLFNVSGLAREQNAVNQEYLYRSNEDGTRIHILSRSLLNENSHTHIWRCGNLDTLKDVSRDQIVEWYGSHYSANLMKVCVYSSMPMNQLLEVVDTRFSQIKNKNFKFEPLNYPVSKTENLGKIAYIEPLQDIKYLVIKWELPPEFSHDLNCHTADLVGDILAEESPKSVTTFLKENGYVHNLYGSHAEDDKKISSFSIYAELTEEGLQNKDEVIAKCYEAIHTFQKSGIPRYRFDEQVSLSKLSYTYQSRPNTANFVAMTAAGLQSEPLASFPSKSMWPSSYSSERIERFLSCLKADQATYFIVAPAEKVGKVYDLKESTAQISYTLETLPQKKLKEWDQIAPSLDIAIAPPNAYIPNNLEVITTQVDFEGNNKPQILAQSDKSLIYYQADQEFQLPEASYRVMVASPSFGEDPESQVLSDLYESSLEDALSQHLEQGSQAGIRGGISISSKFGISFSVDGYSQKAEMFLNKMITEANGHIPKAKDFEKYQDRLMRSYQNQKKQIPGRQAGEAMNNLIIKDYASIDSKISALNNVSFDRFVSYCQNLFENVYIRSMIYGNVTKASASNWLTFLDKSFEYSKPYALDDQYKRAILELGESSSPRFYDEATSQEGNAAFLMVSHGELDQNDRAAYDVLSKSLNTPFFETLRTKQQVGYIVQAFPREYEKKLFSCFLVQSNSCSTRDLLARYELFNEEFLASIGTQEFTEEKFEAIRVALKSEYLKPSNSIAEKASMLTQFAFNYQGDFDLRQERARALDELTFENFANFCYQNLGKTNSRRIAVLINGKMSDVPTLTYQPIHDVSLFKAENLYRPEQDVQSCFLEEKINEEVR